MTESVLFIALEIIVQAIAMRWYKHRTATVGPFSAETIDLIKQIRQYTFLFTLLGIAILPFFMVGPNNAIAMLIGKVVLFISFSLSIICTFFSNAYLSDRRAQRAEEREAYRKGARRM